ncbi:MAG: hypothetical protein DI538_27915, partial [Azospira oryzae]
NNGQTVCISTNFSGNIKITNGAKMVIISGGNFTGNIDGNQGSLIQVKAGGIFNPGTANNLASTILIDKNGTATLSNAGFSNGFGVTNSGSFTWGSFNQNQAITVTNTSCGTMTFSQDINLQNGSTLNNSGNMIMQGLNANSGTTIDNRGRLTVNGNINFAGLLRNQWQAIFKGSTNNFNNGDSIINLYTLTFKNAIQGSFKMRNEGLFWVGGSFQYNGGGIQMNRTNAQVRVSGALVNGGTMKGNGKIYIAGSFSNGSGTLTGKSSAEKLLINQSVPNGSATNVQQNSGMAAEDTATYAGGAGNPDVSCSMLLPMVVSALKGTYNGDVINLTWSTTSEINGKQFMVEYSTDGLSFTTAGTVAAKGNSTEKVNYQYQFSKVNSATLYFRLMMVDVDGRTEYSNTILVKTVGAQKITAGVYPNPFAEKLEVTTTLTKSLPVNVRLLDMNGRLVKSQVYSGQSGFNKWTLTGLSELNKGLYIIEVMAGEERWMQKIIK